MHENVGEAEVEEGNDDVVLMEEEVPSSPSVVNPHGQLPPPAWVLECKHWLPAEIPAAASSVVPSGDEGVRAPSLIIPRLRQSASHQSDNLLLIQTHLRRRF